MREASKGGRDTSEEDLVLGREGGREGGSDDVRQRGSGSGCREGRLGDG